MADERFFSFDEALDQLRLEEEELKRLVSEGEIRAFREGETMRLRRTDVEDLRNELAGGDTVGASEELVFEEDLSPVGMATEEIIGGDMGAETIVDDFDDDVPVVHAPADIDLDEPEAQEDDDDDQGATSRAPVRRSSPREAAAGEESESMGMRAMMILTTVILILGLPVLISMGRGEASGAARTVANLFGAGIPE